MKILKKLSVLLLVFAMILNVGGVFAYTNADNPFDESNPFRPTIKVVDENGTELTEVKSGKTVYIAIYVPAGSYGTLAVAGALNSSKLAAPANNEIVYGDGISNSNEITKSRVKNDGEHKYGVMLESKENDDGSFSYINIDGTKPICKIKINIGDQSVGLLEIMTFATADMTANTTDNAPIAVGAGTPASVTILDSFAGSKAIPSETAVEVGVGADIAATLAAKNIKATVTNGKESTDSDYKSESGYEITNWTDTSATKYDVNAPKTGTYTFTGTVTGNSEKAAQFETLTTEPVTVTVGAIDLASTDANKGFTIAPVKAYAYKQTKVVEGESHKVTADAVKTAVNADATKTKTTITNDNEKIAVEDANITWAVKSGTELDTDVLTSTTADNKVVLEGTVTPAATTTNYKNSAKIEMEVTVVKAEIDGGSISINNPIDNGYITANVTVPAGQFNAGDKIAVKVLANGTEVYRYEQAIPDDVDLTKDYSTSIKLDKKMKDLGFSSSDSSKKTFSVGVEVAGTELKNGTGDDATTTVSGEVKKATTGSAGGINKGGSTTTTYAVTVVETKNGTATVSPEKAASGATVTVKPEPAEGYKVKSVTAVKADGTNVPVDEKAYTFTMPASAVKVTVEFEEGTEPVDPKPQEGKFADVADDFWAAKDIYTLKDAGIIGGKSATEFDPEGDVTRAEFAKMVVGLFGYKATSDAVNFEDCKAEDWFTPYVAAGVEAGVIKGVSDTEFAPNATITREDACTILGRALNKVAQSNELKFTDADKVAEYAAPYVALLSELGYVNGYEDGSFAPTNNITRAEAAKIIAGIYNAKDTTVTEDKTDATDTTDANVEGENTTAPVEENAEDKADTTDTIDVAPEK